MKGYDKVSDQENQIPSQLPKPSSSRKTLIATVSIVTLLLILALTAGAFTRPSHHNPKPLSSSSSNSLNTLCALTPHPKTCFDALSFSSPPLKESDPESILELSLRIASEKVSALSVAFRSIDDMPGEPAVKDCAKLYADAGSQLNETLSEIVTEKKKKGGNWMTREVVGDVKTWISAAMTDGETCSDGLEEMGTVVGSEIKREMAVANQMMSVCLAIVSQMKKLLVVLH